MTMQEEFAKISAIDHLEELRKRLIHSILFFFVAFCISYCVAGDIYNILIQPLADAFNAHGMHDANRQMQATGLTEIFFTNLSLAFFAAFFVTFPFLATQVYIFLAPGLYKRERQALLPFLIAAPILFLMGALLVYYVGMPVAYDFFLSFENNNGPLPIRLEAKVDQYLSLVMSFIIGFGIAFQLPIVLLLLVKVGVLKIEGLKKNRRFAIVIIVVISAFLTPPDVISLLVLASALYALYELSIFASKFMKLS